MELPLRTLDVKCIECGAHFEAMTRKRMGMIMVNCPHCKASQQYMVKPPKKGGEDNEPVGKFVTQMPVRILGEVVSKDGRYVIEKRAKIGMQYGFICPKCNKQIAIKTDQVGEQGATCKECGAKVFFQAYDPVEEERLRQEQERLRQEREAQQLKREEEQRRQQEELRRQEQERLRQEREAQQLKREEEQRRQQEEQRRQQEEQRRQQEEVRPYKYVDDIPDVEPDDRPSQETVVAPPRRRLTNGELQWGGGLLSSPQKVRLYDGTTIVGRKDANTPSDISFIDPEMSRRSVQIDAEPRNGVMSFTLTVLKDLNPVLVNGRRVPQGMSVLLRSGMKIKLGQTTLTFKLV